VFKIELSPSAVRDLSDVKRISPVLYQRLSAAIGSLAAEPFQGKKLRGDLDGKYSLRVGTYRIIYRIFKNRLLVWVIDLGHRREIYR
jgi:mRNA interferase RelE/StbE